jgi:hypothetical protein
MIAPSYNLAHLSVTILGLQVPRPGNAGLVRLDLRANSHVLRPFIQVMGLKAFFGIDQSFNPKSFPFWFGSEVSFFCQKYIRKGQILWINCKISFFFYLKKVSLLICEMMIEM